MKVVYETNTGFTEKYAKLFAEHFGLECWNTYMAKIKVKKHEDVIYFGWVQAGVIQGYKKANKRYNIICVCPVGLTEPNAERRQKLIDMNKITCKAVFPLHGGYDGEKVIGLSKILIDMIADEFEKRTAAGDELSKSEAQMYADLKTGADYFSEDNLRAVYDWYNEA